MQNIKKFLVLLLGSLLLYSCGGDGGGGVNNGSINKETEASRLSKVARSLLSIDNSNNIKVKTNKNKPNLPDVQRMKSRQKNLFTEPSPCDDGGSSTIKTEVTSSNSFNVYEHFDNCKKSVDLQTTPTFYIRNGDIKTTFVDEDYKGNDPINDADGTFSIEHSFSTNTNYDDAFYHRKTGELLRRGLEIGEVYGENIAPMMPMPGERPRPEYTMAKITGTVQVYEHFYPKYLGGGNENYDRNYVYENYKYEGYFTGFNGTEDSSKPKKSIESGSITVIDNETKKSNKVTYDNFVRITQENTERIDGTIIPECANKIEVETIVPLIYDENHCPIEGKLKFKTNAGVVTFNYTDEHILEIDSNDDGTIEEKVNSCSVDLPIGDCNLK